MTVDVLIVDDDLQICETMKQYCENLKVFRKILISNDGADASAKIANQEFSVILIDINIPKKTGINIFRENSNNKELLDKMVIVSGELDKYVLQDATNAGAKHFLVKPFTEEQFKSKIVPILKKSIDKMKAKKSK